MVVPPADVSRPRQPIYLDPAQNQMQPLFILMGLFPAPEVDWECRPELDFFHVALRKHFGLKIRSFYYRIGFDTVAWWAGDGGVLLDDREYQPGCEVFYEPVLEKYE